MTDTFAYQPPADYQSMVITLDHISAIDDGHSRQKFVASSQDAVDSLLALFRYYKEQDIMLSSKTVAMIVAAQATPNVVWVYRTRENVQLVLSTEAWLAACADPDLGDGSAMQAVDKLSATIASAEANLIQSSGGVVPLFFVSFDREVILAADPTEGVAAEVMNGSEIKAV